MNLNKQIRSYRILHSMSQDELAEKIFVSRQSISNWENGKTYPDIHSLLLMSTLFHIPLDELVSGDFNLMKEVIQSEDIKKMKTLSYIMTIGLLLIISIPIPLVYYFNLLGILLWIIICIPVFYVALKIDSPKRIGNIQTYKEICAFMEGRRLDELDTSVEKGKYRYQQIVYLTLLATFAVILNLAMAYFFI